jgi:DNA polymerase-3 subunit alpha
LDGACRIPELVAAAKKLDMPALALTDHGVMYGTIKFYKACLEARIKPIIGCEIYLAPKTMRSKNGRADAEHKHLILLAKNLTGYKNLIKLVTMSHLEGFYYKPRLDKMVLSQLSEGLIALSGCMFSEIAELIAQDKFEEAKKAAEEYLAIFGEDFYLELQDQGIGGQKKVKEGLIELGKILTIPLVVSNDVHYTNKEDSLIQDTLLCIQTGKPLDEEGRLKFSSDEFYLKSAEEMEQIFQDVPQALENSIKIAQLCNVELELEKTLLPDFPVPADENCNTFLEKLCQEGLKKRYPATTEEIKKRIDYELDVIKKMGFAAYFLIVQDFISFARTQGVQVGPGRGSAAGSLVAYALGITNIDPLKYHLLFERFLNPERISMPDIDIDFCFERRQEVLDYVNKKYGSDHVAQIITFGTMQSRAAVRDVGRTQKVPLPEVDRVAKLIPVAPDMTIPQALKITPELAAYYQNNDRVRQLIDVAIKVEGLTRHASTHAAGVVISQKPLLEYVPLQKNENQVVTQFPMEDLQTIGLLKIDFLGLKNLTIMDKTIKIIQENRNIFIDLEKIPLNDERTFELLGRGETAGIFQLESSGMRNLLKDLRPKKFEDLIALLALYRPGPLGSGMTQDFVNRKNGKTKIVYELPELREILAETYGIIVYQEQVMQIASRLAGFTLAEADVLRRAMSKKKAAEMKKIKEKFITGCLKNGFPKEKAEKIYGLFDKFAEYGFNKSHSAAYAVIAYQTAYLKANFPLEFMASLLTNNIGNEDKISSYVTECKKLGIKVLPPNINESAPEFLPIKEAIRYGLAAIKNIGRAAIESIVAVRQKSGSFLSFFDFCRRVDTRTVNKRVVESLIKAGAFDSFGKTRAQLLSQLDRTLQKAAAFQKETTGGQTALFEETTAYHYLENSAENDDAPIEEFPKEELLRMEKDMLGVYLTDHPLNHIREIFLAQVKTSSSSLADKKDGAPVTIGGIISKARKILTRQQKTMFTAVLEDFKGHTPIVVFPNTYEKYSACLTDDAVVIVEGKVNRREEEVKIIAERISLLSERPQKTVSLHIEITDQNNNEVIEKLKKTLIYYKGQTPVYLHTEESVIATSQDFWINLNPAVIAQLEELVGTGRVWTV